MRERSVRFELDPSLDGIEVLIRAPAEDAELTALLEQLAAMRPITLDEMDSIRLMNRIDTPTPTVPVSFWKCRGGENPEKR